MTRSNNKKRGAKLGQHLLKNASVARLVAQSAGVQKGTRVYEIGPGRGALTKELLVLGAEVFAIEKDPMMVASLNESFEKEIADGRLKVIESDARDATPDAIFPKGDYVIAANIPYYITGELIRTALTAKNQPHAIALLVQKEVADRIVGNPERGRGTRSKKESILSLSVKAYGTPRYVKTVSRGNFNPPPAVDSAILAIENISRKNFKKISEDAFFKTVKAGFASKRKTLAGNLKKIFGEHAKAAMETAGIQEKARAEDVSLDRWVVLSAAIGS